MFLGIPPGRGEKGIIVNEEYQGPDRRTSPPLLSESQIEAIAERAAEVALEKVYTSIGRSVVNKVLWMVGAGTLAVAAWLNGAGHLK